MTVSELLTLLEKALPDDEVQVRDEPGGPVCVPVLRIEFGDGRVVIVGDNQGL